jgi:phosphoglycerate-specific signal transduction histidine kinase
MKIPHLFSNEEFFNCHPIKSNIMKDQLQQTVSEASDSFIITPLSLRKLVSRVQASLLPLAAARGSFIINGIEEELSVSADEDILAFVIGNLICNAVNSSTSLCIRVETICQGNHIQVIVKSSGKANHATGMQSLLSMSGAAARFGGIVAIQSEPRGGYAVVLSLGAAA